MGWVGDGRGLPAPKVVGGEAVYVEAEPGVDVKIRPLRTGFEQFYVVKSRPETPVSWQVPLTLPGLTARADDDGGVSFVDAEGTVASRLLPAHAWDAKVNGAGDPVNEAPVALTVKATGKDRAVLTITPDAEWMADPERVFPVTVDPTYASGSLAPSFDTYVQSNVSNTDYSGSTELRAGSYDGTVKTRSFLNFPVGVSPLLGKTVMSASLSLYETYSYSCTAASVSVYHSGVASTSTRWASQPTIASLQGSVNAAKGYSSSCPGGRINIPVSTAFIQTWANATSGSDGLMVRATNETATAGYKKFASMETSNDPYLSFTYNRKPTLASSIALTPSATWSATTYAASTTPKVTMVASDPDSNKVHLIAQVFSTTSGLGADLVTQCTTPDVTSGTAASCTLPVALTDGSTYYIRAGTIDDQGMGGGWTSLTVASAKFIVAANDPPAPVISCPAPYGNGDWPATVPSADVACTVTYSGAAPNGAAQGQTSIDGSTPSFATITPGTPIGFSVSKAAGWHSIVATARSRSGRTTTATYSFGYGPGGLSLPVDQAKSNDVFLVSAAAPLQAGATSTTASLQWRPAGLADATSEWTTAPNFSPTVTTGGGKVSVGMDANGNLAPARWSATAGLPESLRRVPMTMEIQVCFMFTLPGGTSTSCTYANEGAEEHHTVVKVPHAFGGGFPTSGAGPGQVALWTGEFAMSESDVDIPGYTGSLSISRSHSTFDAPADAVNGVFGPGWTAGFDGPDAGVAGAAVIDRTGVDGTIVLAQDGETLTFRQPGKGRVKDQVGTYTAADTDTKLDASTLVLSATGTAPNRTFTLTYTEEDQTATSWSATEAAGTTVPSWAPAGVSEPGITGQTTYARDGAGRITRITAPLPPGVSSCTATAPKVIADGCRALQIDYATSTTATASAPGDIAGQVSKIWYLGWNPATTTNKTAVASYKYLLTTPGTQPKGRLHQAIDDRTGLVTAYTYAGSDGSQSDPVRLTGLTPPGLKPWHMVYDTANGHRLQQVTRDPVTGAGAAQVQASFVYDAPTSGSGLPDVTAASVADWNQDKTPAYGVAVFASDHVPSTLDASAMPAEEWSWADLQYTDAQGYTVNAASYGAGVWQITATDYDTNGNVIRTFDAGAIAQLRADSATGDDAGLYATVTRYNDRVPTATDQPEITPAGLLVTDVWGPARHVLLSDGTSYFLGRPHTHTDYDQGVPNGGVLDPGTGARYQHLPTTATTSVTDTAMTTDVEQSGQSTTSYDKINTSDPDTWALGLPTKTTTVVDGGTNDIARVTHYDSEGRVIVSRQPSSNGSDAGTTKTVYYQAATGQTACDGKPQWAGLVCRVYPAAAPSSGPVLPDKVVTDYTWQLQPKTIVETSPTSPTATTRTTITAYLPAGTAGADQPDTVTVTTSNLGGSTPVPVTKASYDPATGAVVKVASMSVDGATETATLLTGYDAWGRPTSTTNSYGEVTSTSYIPGGQAGAGQVDVVTDAKGTTDYGYGTDANGATERRGIPTTVTVSGAGTYAAAYDADGALTVQTMPGGLRQDVRLDAAGEPVGLSYSGDVVDPDTGTTSTGVWLSWTQVNDITGRVAQEWTPAGTMFDDPTEGAQGYDRKYTYDKAARLVKVEDRTAAAGVLPTDPDDPATLAAACTTRTYGFDKNGNRTASKSYPAGTGGACSTTTTPTSSRTWTVDNADRLSTAGYTYDAFGRTLTIPAVDNPTSGGPALTIGYYATDAAESITAGSEKTSYTLDPAGRRLVATTAPTGGGAATSVLQRHYGDGSDNPAWVVDTVTDTTTRYAESLAGDLSAEITTTGTGTTASLALTNIHGDAVTTITLTTNFNSIGIEAWADYTEGGIPRNPTATATVAGPAGYGWLGAKQRATDPGSHLILMGVRLYNRTTGRFTSVDPVDGGNENAYNYPNDPVNLFDISGRWVEHQPWYVASNGGLYMHTVERWIYHQSRYKVHTKNVFYLTHTGTAFLIGGVAGVAAAIAAAAGAPWLAAAILAGALVYGGWCLQVYCKLKVSVYTTKQYYKPYPRGNYSWGASVTVSRWKW